MTSSNPIADDSFEESLANARQRERKRFRLFIAAWIVGALALAGLAYSWNDQLVTVQQKLEKSQAAVEELAGAASTLAVQAEKVNELSATVSAEQTSLKKETSVLRKQLEAQENTRLMLEEQLKELNADLSAANGHLLIANKEVTEAASRAASAGERADQASTAASAAIQSAQNASNTATLAKTAAQAVQNQATEVNRHLTQLEKSAETRFRNIERSLKRAHYTFLTHKANPILIDGSEVFLYFGDWNEREGGVEDFCVAITKVQSKPPAKGFILTRPFKRAQPSQQNCLPLGLAQQEVKGPLPLLKIGQAVTFRHDDARYTVTPRFRIRMPILHDQVGFDVEREPDPPSP